jgi:phosphoglycolate phosphatase
MLKCKKQFTIINPKGSSVSIRAVIFDLDGTLLDTLEDIADSTNTILAQRHFPTHDLEDYRRYVGDGVTMLIERALPAEQRTLSTITKCVQAFRDEYDLNWNNKTQPYPDIDELLNALTARNVKLAVLSNKPDDFTKRCVPEYFPQWPFAMVKGLNQSTPPKPDPTGAQQIAVHLDLKPSEILFLGDSGTDMKTAINAGMVPIAALWGFKPRVELELDGVQAFIERPQELLDFVT